MNKILKILVLAVLGGCAGWLIWLPIYLSHKTPAIEFDGPAGLGMLLATAAGVFIFGVVGIVLAARKKL
jgi:hypothetical protein